MWIKHKIRNIVDVICDLPFIDEVNTEHTANPYDEEYIEWCRIEEIPREVYDPYGAIHDILKVRRRKHVRIRST